MPFKASRTQKLAEQAAREKLISLMGLPGEEARRRACSSRESLPDLPASLENLPDVETRCCRIGSTCS